MNYEKQGRDFLTKTGTTLEILKAVPQKTAPWIAETGGHYKERGAKPVHYSCTLRNEKGEYTFDFFGSIADAEKSKKPTAYGVLTCLHDSAGDSFADFCANYGYDTDSIKAKSVYEAVQEQERNMRRLFTSDELAALAEIA